MSGAHRFSRHDLRAIANRLGASEHDSDDLAGPAHRRRALKWTIVSVGGAAIAAGLATGAFSPTARQILGELFHPAVREVGASGFLSRQSDSSPVRYQLFERAPISGERTMLTIPVRVRSIAASTSVLAAAFLICPSSSDACAGTGQDLAVPTQYSTIQSAIDAAVVGDRVLVSPGTYLEQLNLSGKGIQLIGVGGADVTFIDGEHYRTVIIGSGEPSTCLVQGITIQNGQDGGYHSGGGVRLYSSNAVFDSCKFVGNISVSPSWWGAGAWRSEHGSPTISNCVFENNVGAYASSCVYHYLSGSIDIRDCNFINNESPDGQNIHIQTEGGTINASIARCDFSHSRGTGSQKWTYQLIGFWNPYGGSITCPITDCHFTVDPIDLGSITTSSAVSLGSYCNSFNSVSMINNTVCGVQQLVRTDACSSSGWIDGGGNVLHQTCCWFDIVQNGVVDGVDLAVLLSVWGTSGSEYPRADTNHDGIVSGPDLAVVLGGWGPCP